MQKTIKTRSGRVLVLPTPAEDAAINAGIALDPDAYSLTDAEWAQVKPVAKRGRPLGSGTKTQITLRIDTATLDTFKAAGDGWQSRINAVLRDAVAHGRA